MGPGSHWPNPLVKTNMNNGSVYNGTYRSKFNGTQRHSSLSSHQQASADSGRGLLGPGIYR
ncbi:MAG: hypothetical protein NPIRA03_24740 [Nitrospirales bacterium]|nr:MAG: hypothetical protein NPIRA03_24740 [Nitrospirales bacterium]